MDAASSQTDVPAVELIAEAAQGYAADPAGRTAFLVDAAAAAGADAVKFQLVYADELCTPDYVHHRHLVSLESPDEMWSEVAARCAERGIDLYLDVFGDRSLALAEQLGAGVKVHSGDMLNVPLLEALARSSARRILLSAGGTLGPEIDRAVDLLRDRDIVVLHGFQAFPTAAADSQLARLAQLGARYPGIPLGYADHLAGDDPAATWLPALAVGLGATVIEKHLTAARAVRDVDWESALAPDEFAAFARNVRLACAAIGSANGGTDFGMTAAEGAYRQAMKKHVVAAGDLAAGTVLTTAALALKRTSATADDVIIDLDEAVGRTLRSDVRAGSPLSRQMLA